MTGGAPVSAGPRDGLELGEPRPRRPLATLRALAADPRAAAAILLAWATGKRLRARQRRAALIGIDHALDLPPALLDRFPAEPPGEADDFVVLGYGTPVVGARARLAAAFRDHPDLRAIYGDALVQRRAGGPVRPLLPPVFDPDLLLAVDYFGPALAVRRGALPPGEGATSPTDAALRIAERHGERAIGHLPGVLAVVGPGAIRDNLGTPFPPPSAGEGDPRRESGEGSDGSGRDQRDPTSTVAPLSPPALQGTLPRRGEREAHGDGCPTSVDDAAPRGEGLSPRLAPALDGTVRVVHAPRGTPLATVIVPTRDRLDLLRPCLESLRDRTDWPALEILVCDNDSREPETLAYLQAWAGEGREGGARGIVPWPGPFNFAAMNNAAAARARGRLLVFVNNDVAAFRADWLALMAREALRPEVGAVGAKLLDGAGRIQHGGIVLGTGGLVTHGHRHFPGDAPGYLSALEATHRVSAVTAACLMVEAEKFRAVGGFDAEAFAVDFNDVDLCLRLDEAGHRTLLVPGAVLHHYEAASRRWTQEARARHAAEIAAFRRRWGPLLAQDPHYHPGFDPGLSTHARLAAGFPASGPVRRY